MGIESAEQYSVVQSVVDGDGWKIEVKWVCRDVQVK